MIRKDVAIAVLITFMLTLGFFGIQITRSTTPYDAWLDYNEDGTINMRDIGAAVQAFGASGDPTKNVTVTNWPAEMEPTKTIVVCENFTVNTDHQLRLPFCPNIAGYNYVSLFVSWRTTYSPNAYLYCAASCDNITSFTFGPRCDINLETAWPAYKQLQRPGLQFYAPEMQFELYLQGTIELTIVLYCYN